MLEQQASARVLTIEPYSCACGYEGKGHAAAEGSGQAQGGRILFGNRHAAEEAEDAARAEAWSEAMSNVALARCPRCDRADRAAWVGWLEKRVFWALAMGSLPGAILGFVWLGLVEENRGAGFFVSFAIGMIAGAAGVLRWLGMRKLEATARTQFHPPR